MQKYQHAESSVTSYRGAIVRYLQWLAANRPTLTKERFKAAVDLDKHGSPTRNSIMATLDSAPASPSLYFASLQPDDFLRWVHDLKAPKTGLHLFYNTYNIKRAVFHYLCELYEWRVHENFEENLSTYISGLKRTLAKDETAKAGKEKEPIQCVFIAVSQK